MAGLPSWAPDGGQRDTAHGADFRGVSEMAAVRMLDILGPVDAVFDGERNPPIIQQSSLARFDDAGSLVLRGMLVNRTDGVHHVVRVPCLDLNSGSRAPEALDHGVMDFRYLVSLPGSMFRLFRIFYRSMKLIIYSQSLLEFAAHAKTTTTRTTTTTLSRRFQPASHLFSLFQRAPSPASSVPPTAQEVERVLAGHEFIAKQGVNRVLRRCRVHALLPSAYRAVLALWLCYVAATKKDGMAREFVFV